MLTKLTDADKDKIIEYIKDYIEDCLYLYIDVSNYSIENDNCEVWVHMNGNSMDYIVMKYYDSYQLFSHNYNYLPNEVKEFIEDNPVMMISGRKDLIESLSLVLAGYKTTYGYVYEMNRRMPLMGDSVVTWGCVDDADEIADLIQTDFDLGGHYTKEVLVKQLVDRIESGTGRSCIMREKDRLIAHTATYAENDNVAIISGTVVHPDYRNKDYYLQITSALQGMLAKEKKKVYTFAVNERLINYHNKIHRICGEYGKLERLVN